MTQLESQAFEVMGGESVQIEVDLDFSLTVNFTAPRRRTPKIESGPCVNSLGFSAISATHAIYYLVGTKKGQQDLDFGDGCVVSVTVTKKSK